AYNTGSSNIPTNSLTSLTFDSLQNLYIGSFDKGLIKKVGNSFVYWDTQNSVMPDNLVYAVLVERNGIIWCGTETHGVVRFDEFGVTSIGENSRSESSSISIYPNPASYTMNVRFRQAAEQHIRITDKLGNTVQDLLVSNDHATVDVSDLDPGVYFLLKIAVSGTEAVRFVVNR
ncbi:MAG: T9SS type A sorting domain-containing protein, partial [Bacteroidota bacterium]